MRKRRGHLISRFDYSGAAGWVFRHPAHPGKLFSDSKYSGSWRSSARAAIAHRDNLVLPCEQNKTVRFFHIKPSKKSKTGIPGVFLYERKGDYGTRLSVIASYYGKKYEMTRKEFSVGRRTVQEALELAITFRNKGLEKIKSNISA